MGKVLITTRSVASSASVLDYLRNAGHDLFLHTSKDGWAEADLTKAIPGMDALIVGLDPITQSVLAAGRPTLKIVARNGVGYNNIDLRAAREAGVRVTVTPGASKESVAELALGLMISLLRQIPAQNSHLHSGNWVRLPGRQIAGKTIGIIGLGSIGGEVLKRARAFGARLLAYDIKQRSALIAKYDFAYVDLETILRQSDILTLHVPATPQTRKMLNAGTIANMRDGIYIVNTARGDIIDEQALSHALNTGKIAGYAADVFTREPLGPGHPFLSGNNVILTPHCGAYTDSAVEKSGLMAAEEVILALAGKAPNNPIAE